MAAGTLASMRAQTPRDSGFARSCCETTFGISVLASRCTGSETRVASFRRSVCSEFLCGLLGCMLSSQGLSSDYDPDAVAHGCGPGLVRKKWSILQFGAKSYWAEYRTVNSFPVGASRIGQVRLRA